MRLTAFLAILIVTISLPSCGEGGNSTYNINTEDLAQEAIEDFENYRLKITLVDSQVLEFPSPVELAQNYKNSGMKFIPGITNPALNYQNYHTHSQKALNFGVYSADLSYCVLNDMGQCASEYLMSMQTLSHDIGLSEIFKYEVLATDFTESLGNQDSMTQMVYSIQEDLDATLRKNGIQERAILFYTGAWVESAYLAFNSQSSYSNTVEPATMEHLSNQLDMLGDINEQLDQLSSKTSEIRALEIQLNEFEELTNSIRVTQMEDSIILNPNDLAKIRGKVETIRDQIVAIR
ncbi:MAG: hypothetical protein CL840_11665 [Crocinitomicaceae bacterium]|nr:hypothetical protein [Crocinitomicaceae bacterium]|tara:strand:- start:539 stop:1414 length:876 start_codon:yes stop_codon:yes gene_type:complete